MSKYSAKDKISKKLEDSIAQTNAPLTEKDDLTPDEIAKLTPEEFDFAEYDETASERAGYSNYSYWRSTIRVFFIINPAPTPSKALTTINCHILLESKYNTPLVANSHSPTCNTRTKSTFSVNLPPSNIKGIISNDGNEVNI